VCVEKRVTTEKDVVEEAAAILLLTGTATKGVWNLTWIQSKTPKGSFFQLGKNKQISFREERKENHWLSDYPHSHCKSAPSFFFIVKEESTYDINISILFYFICPFLFQEKHTNSERKRFLPFKIEWFLLSNLSTTNWIF